uniref:Charged multivesicular body protein 4C n=1 Tax=Chelonoidis abingdonii TaxID=106734 RepID=A0A8C0HJT7_CHEAB
LLGCLCPTTFPRRRARTATAPTPTPATMSKIGKLFKGGGPGRPKGRAGPTPQEALARLRETEEMLTKKQEYLETRIQRELAAAKQHGTRNKRAALQALKRKKRYEKQLSQIDGTLSTIEFQREALENSHTNTEVFKNMVHSVHFHSRGSGCKTRSLTVWIKCFSFTETPGSDFVFVNVSEHFQ